MSRPLQAGRSRVLRTASAVLAKDRRVRVAYAFGSFLTRTDARDLDIAVLLAPCADPEEAAGDLADRIERAIGRRLAVDLRLLNQAPVAFAFEVISTGRLLAERNRDGRLDWEAHLCSRYQDSKPMLDFYDRRFLAL